MSRIGVRDMLGLLARFLQCAIQGQGMRRSVAWREACGIGVGAHSQHDVRGRFRMYQEIWTAAVQNHGMATTQSVSYSINHPIGDDTARQTTIVPIIAAQQQQHPVVTRCDSEVVICCIASRHPR